MSTKRADACEEFLFQKGRLLKERMCSPVVKALLCIMEANRKSLKLNPFAKLVVVEKHACMKIVIYVP